MRSDQFSVRAGRVAMSLLAVWRSSRECLRDSSHGEHDLQLQGQSGWIFPLANLVADLAGNLYGTTEFGGGSNFGTVFQLSPATVGGTWIETTLYSFRGSGIDGAFPRGTLTFDKQGNLYGTTQQGGLNNSGPRTISS